MGTTATATVKGGFFEVNGVASLTSMSGENGLRRQVAQELSRKGLFAERELWETLTGAAAGSAALKTYGEIEPNVELGGKRTIVVTNLVNRNTTAADVTRIVADFLTHVTKTYTTSPIANGDRNPLGTR